LEKLGFPWILSYETSLFNGLHGIFRENNIGRPFALDAAAGTEDAAIEVMRMHGIIHQET
jgi:hypothetical protein